MIDNSSYRGSRGRGGGRGDLRGRGGFRGQSRGRGRGSHQGVISPNDFNDDSSRYSERPQRGGFRGRGERDGGSRGGFPQSQKFSESHERGRGTRGGFNKRVGPAKTENETDDKGFGKIDQKEKIERKESAISHTKPSLKSLKTPENKLSKKRKVDSVDEEPSPENVAENPTTASIKSSSKDNGKSKKIAPGRTLKVAEYKEIAEAMGRRLNEKANRRLCLKSLPGTTTVADLKLLVPDLSDWRLVSKGTFGATMAFVDLPTEKLAEQYYATLSRANKLKGQAFVVDYCGTKSRHNAKELGPTDGATLDITRLYIAGLKPDYTMEQVQKLFPKAAHVSKRGKRRGADKEKSAFVFVQFNNDVDAMDAFNTSEKLHVDGRELTVIFAYKDKQRTRDAETSDDAAPEPPSKKNSAGGRTKATSVPKQAKAKLAQPEESGSDEEQTDDEEDGE